MAFQLRANQNRKLRSLFIKLILQAYQTEHLACAFVERDKDHLMAVVEVAELVGFGSGKFTDMRKESKTWFGR